MLLLFGCCNLWAQPREITTPDGALRLQFECMQGVKVNRLTVNGKSCLAPDGAYTGYTTSQGTFTSKQASSSPTVKASGKTIRIMDIRYGDVSEEWTFETRPQDIQWTITRTYLSDIQIEETQMPCWNMADMNTWKGGIFDNGGMVWCKYLRGANDTYGVHTGGVTLWQESDPTALRIQGETDDALHLATTYLHGTNDAFIINQMVTPTELRTRYMQNRCVGGHRDIFASYKQGKGTVHVTLSLQPLQYNREYPVGQLVGIDSVAVRELMNTTGRYGVVDNGIVGANGWTTNWKCLHEPFFSQVGLAHQALLDDNYVRNMSLTLDCEGEHAIAPDGRVASRWHGDDSDQMPNTYDYQTGYYEARWGYTVDSQTGYVICTTEQFELNGDLEWLRSHKEHCEKALDWMLRRDTNGNGITEMMNNNIAEGKCSDWLDIVWAGFENGFVNAQLYDALNHWSQCEQLLGDTQRSQYYAQCASKMKESFNRDVKDGGFWYPEKKQYIYWRDQDGSIHGDNLVTPVNFAIIAFGLCDDPERIAIILDEIERRNQAENLFHWPLCYDSFRREEVSGGNWPFPNYENGDIFPTWGYMGIRAYSEYDRSIALKYIHKLLAQYRVDGLSSQRYSRVTQQGQGSDILAGICTSITALYRDIYGVRPHWNRMGLEPHLTSELNGTSFQYLLRGKRYLIQLTTNQTILSDDKITVHAPGAIGLNTTDRELTLYADNQEERILTLYGNKIRGLEVQLTAWTDKTLAVQFNRNHPGRIHLTGLRPQSDYTWQTGSKSIQLRTDSQGCLDLPAKLVSRSCQLKG